MQFAGTRREQSCLPYPYTPLELDLRRIPFKTRDLRSMSGLNNYRAVFLLV